MSNILQNVNRHGNFTSSEIVCLTSMGTRDMTEEEKAEHKKLNPKSAKKTIECWPGKAAITYINEKNMERRLGRSLDNDVDTRACSWGNICEEIGFPKLVNNLGYSYNSKETIIHPLYEWWAGTPDGYSLHLDQYKCVCDFKAPYTLKSFCALVQPLYDGLEGTDAMNAIRFGYTDKNGLPQPAHKDGEKFYWQLVSGACLEDCEYGELIPYCPYESELDTIRRYAGDSAKGEYLWLSNALNEQMPHLKDGGYYNNYNLITFPIPQSDKDYLTDLVIKAGKLLINI